MNPISFDTFNCLIAQPLDGVEYFTSSNQELLDDAIVIYN